MANSVVVNQSIALTKDGTYYSRFTIYFKPFAQESFVIGDHLHGIRFALSMRPYHKFRGPGVNAAIRIVQGDEDIDGIRWECLISVRK